MKRVLAALAVTTMLFAAPAAPAIAGKGGGNNSVKCNGPGDDTCGNNTVVGDTDGDGKVRYECHNKSGGLIVVNAANCTNIFFPVLVIVDL